MGALAQLAEARAGAGCAPGTRHNVQEARLPEVEQPAAACAAPSQSDEVGRSGKGGRVHTVAGDRRGAIYRSGLVRIVQPGPVRLTQRFLHCAQVSKGTWKCSMRTRLTTGFPSPPRRAPPPPARRADGWNENDHCSVVTCNARSHILHADKPVESFRKLELWGPASAPLSRRKPLRTTSVPNHSVY